MSQVFVFLMALAVVGWVAYPLIKGIRSPDTASLEEELEQQVKARRKRKKHHLICPSCGSPYRPGDLYCSRCGQKLEE